MKFSVNENPDKIFTKDKKGKSFEVALVVNFFKIAQEVDSKFD